MGENAIDVTVNAVDNASGVLGSIAEGIGISFGTKLMDVVGNAFSFVGDQLSTFVEAAGEAQDVGTLFNAVLDNSPLASYKQKLLDLAEAYSKTTRFEDENIISAETVLARYQNLGADVMPQVLRTTLDMATLMKTDATSAAQQLGKALEDISGGSLTLLGRTKLLTKEQKDQAETMAKAGDAAGAQAYVLDILDKKTSGLAEAMGTTYKGKFEIFQNTLQNLQEAAGGPLLDALGNVMSKLTEIANDPELQGRLINLTTLIGTEFTNAVNIATPLVDTFLKTVDNGGNVFDGLKNAMLSIDWGGLWTNTTTSFSNWVHNIDWGKITTDLKTGIDNIDWNQLGKDFAVNVKTFEKFVSDEISRMIKEGDWKGLFGSIGTAFMEFVTGAFGSNFTEFKAVWANNWEQLKIAVHNWGEDLKAWGAQLWANFQIVFNFGLDDVLRIIVFFVGQWTKPFRDQVANFTKSGRDMIAGVLTGIENGAAQVLNRIYQLGQQISQAFANAIGAHSDSEVFKQHAKNILGGLTSGLQNGMDLPIRAMVGVSSSFVSASVPAMQGAAGSSGNRASTGGNNSDLLAIMKQIAENTAPDRQARMIRDYMLQGAR